MLARNPRLTNILTNLFRKQDALPGGTAAALRAELSKVGAQTGGKSHLQKALEGAQALSNALEKQPLSDFERALAQSVLDDLGRALEMIGAP